MIKRNAFNNFKNKLFDTQVSKRGLIGINEHKTLKFNKDYVYEIAIIEPKSSPKNIYWIKSEKGDISGSSSLRGVNDNTAESTSGFG